MHIFPRFGFVSPLEHVEDLGSQAAFYSSTEYMHKMEYHSDVIMEPARRCGLQ